MSRTGGVQAEGASGRWRAGGRRRWLAGAAAIGILGLAVYLGVGAYVYYQFAPVAAQCVRGGAVDDAQEPTSFQASVIVDGVRRQVDTMPYRMPKPTEVTFPARGDPRITIAGWWEPGTTLDTPAVIVTHGAGGCRRNAGNLLIAGMLQRHAIAVLLIDMRNHGDSTVVDGKFAAGNAEYRDVLGAFDWLRSQGVPARRIGLFGFSGGAIASMIAMGEEPSIAAAWADSSFTDTGDALRAGLRDGGWPTMLDGAAILAARILTGHDIAALSPRAAAARLAGRPIALTQGDRDDVFDPAYVETLANAVRVAGGSPVVWRVPGAGHTQAHFLYPDEYEHRLAGFFEPALGGAVAGA